MASNQVSTLGIRIRTTGAENAKKAIRGIGSTASRIKSQILSLNGALAGLGAGAVGRDIIKTASNLESLRVRLKFLTGSSKDASKAFDTMVGFAGRVPFALEEIQQASPSLLTVADSVEDLNELLEITGDIAAVSGLTFQDTAMQLQRAMAGGIASADMFRERGVTAFLGFQAGVSYSADETREKIIQMFRDGETTAKGATSELAKTFQGQVSMMQDAWFKLKVAIADSGVFEYARDIVLELTEYLGRPSTIENMKSFGNTVTSIGKAMKSIIESVMGLPTVVQEVGLIMYLFGGKKAKLIVGAVTGIQVALNSMSQTMKQLKDQANDSKAPIQDFFDEFGVKESNMPTSTVTNQTQVVKVSTQVQDQNKINTRQQLDSITKKYKGSLESLYPKLTKLEQAELDLLDVEFQLQDKFNEGKITWNNLQRDLSHVSHAFKDVRDAIEKAEIDKVVADVSQNISDSIADALTGITDGTKSFTDSIKGILRNFASQLISMQINRLLMNAFGPSVSSFIFGNSGGFMGMTPTGKAVGGNVRAGEPYMVGERGAEMFVPSQNGAIVPNSQLGGNGTVINVTYAPQVNSLDPRTASNIIAENAPTILGVVRNAFNRTGTQVAI